MRRPRGVSAYSQNNAGVESNSKLIEMLYEGALRFACKAKVGLEQDNVQEKVYWINRTIAIYTELINSLNYDAGNVASYLGGLYNREIQLLTTANINNDKDSIEEVIKVTNELLDSWRENVVKN